jgi:hypothetical protein
MFITHELGDIQPLDSKGKGIVRIAAEREPTHRIY